MMKDPWIRESGICEESEVSCITGKMADCSWLMALYADRFMCEKLPESLPDDWSRLLEIRIFGEQAELWLHRSALKAPFSWRIADDRYLAAAVADGDADAAFFRNPDNYRMESRQLLDIDGTYRPSGEAQYGSRMLRTIGGGTYELPITDAENAVELVSYINYDQNGAAKVVDYRLKGFGTIEGGNET